jgi:hypothetical protein
MRICLTIITFFLTTQLFAQTNDSTYWTLPKKELKDVGVLFGIHQFDHTFLELGISATKQSRNVCFWSSYFYGSSLSAEYNPFNNKAGLAASAWTTLLFLNVGANVNSYTDFQKFDLGLKPFIGIGSFLSLTYGYNFLLINKHINGLNRHSISIRLHLTIKERK